MKKLSLIALLLLSYRSFAGFEIRIGGGISTNTGPGTLMGLQGLKKLDINPVGTIKLAYNLRRNIQLGIGAEVLKLSNKTEKGTWKYIYTNPGIPVYAFANRKTDRKRTELYYGLSAGWIFCTSDTSFTQNTMTFFRSTGPTAGLQLGLNIKLSRSLAFNTELAARYARLYYSYTESGILNDPNAGVNSPYTQQPGGIGIIYADKTEYKENYGVFYFPLTVGLKVDL